MMMMRGLILHRFVLHFFSSSLPNITKIGTRLLKILEI